MYRVFLLFFLFTLYIVGCSNTNTNPPLEIVTPESDLLVQVTIKPNPANMLKKNDLYITLNNKNGKAIEGAKVKVDLTMEEMNHGNLSYAANPKEAGVYWVEVIPVMQGTWVANVTAEAEKQTLKARYTFEAKR